MTYDWIQNAGLLVALGLVVWLWVRLGRVEARLDKMCYVVGVDMGTGKDTSVTYRKEAPDDAPKCSMCGNTRRGGQFYCDDCYAALCPEEAPDGQD